MKKAALNTAQSTKTASGMIRTLQPPDWEVGATGFGCELLYFMPTACAISAGDSWGLGPLLLGTSFTRAVRFT